MTDFRPGPDPVPSAARDADPERHERARRLEWEVEAHIHPDFDPVVEEFSFWRGLRERLDGEGGA